MLRRSVVALAFVTAVACCGAASAQSVAPTKVVAPEKLAGYWAMVHSSVEADVPNIAKNIDRPGCATVSFVVGSNGNTGNIKVERVVPEGDFRQIAESMAKNLHFEPTLSNTGRQPVKSWLIFPFNLPADPVARKAVMQPCVIDKLGAGTP